MDYIIGIEVFKDRLDVHQLKDGSYSPFPNWTTGQSKLHKWLAMLPSLSVEMNYAIRGYHRQFEWRLEAKPLPFAKLYPKWARQFAQARGKLAKTDRVDSEMLARMGVPLQLTPKTPQAENL